MRRALAISKANWSIDAAIADSTSLPKYGHGANLSQGPLAQSIPKTDISQFLKAETANPFLRQHRINSGFLKVLNPATLNVGAAPTAPVVATTSTSVDWRNRFGWNWLNNVKNQNPCGSCWVFGAVGLVEAMEHIEHGYWSSRSEGDVHDGMGAKCSQGGWPSTALDWIKTNGIADPGCRPYETTDTPVPPTSDRNGRTLKLSGYTTLSNVADQKTWIDQIGPITACFSCYYDFETFGFTHQTGVYTCNPASGLAGGHCILIVGYDDARQAWLIRNSWGAGWGMAGSPGCLWLGYGQADIDKYAKYGIANTAINPDPWTKRRSHNGNLIESGNGQLFRNFEVFATAPGNAVRHYWRDGSSNNWAVAETQANDCAGMPTVTSTTYNRNFEMIYPTTSNMLHHRFYDQGAGQWKDGGVFGPNTVKGVAGFIQGDFGAPGNFEVVAALANGTLVHWWRNAGNFAWAQSAVFGSNVAFGGATLVQRFDRGLDYICVNNDGTMQRYYRPMNTGIWQAAEKFGSNVHSAPVMIRSEFGTTTESTPGNYELCVVVNGQIQHWWTAGEAAANWKCSATFGTNVKSVVGLIQGSYGFDLEVVAQLTNGSLQHFYRNAQWNVGPVFGTSVVSNFQILAENQNQADKTIPVNS